MKTTNFFVILMSFFLLQSCDFKSDEKPNILWVVTDDNSIHYIDLYNNGGAEMPAISNLQIKASFSTMPFQTLQCVRLQEVQ